MITLGRVRELAGVRQDPVVTSLYLDVDGRTNPRPIDYERRLNNLRKQVEERIEPAGGEKPPHDYRTSARADLDRIDQWVEEGFDRSQTRGLAFFACSAHDWFEVVRLPQPVNDEVALEKHPSVRQLELLIAEQRSYGVVLVDRGRVRVFRDSADGFVELATEKEDQGSRKERGGYAGPSVQRHAEEIGRRHFREFAQTVRSAFATHPVDEIIVGATEEDFTEFRAELDNDLAARICRRVSISTNAPDEEVRAAVEDVAAQRTEQRRTEVWQRFDAAMSGAEPAVAGIADVLDALNEKRVELMLVDEAYEEPGRRCTTDGLLMLQAGTCPADGTPTEAVDDIVDEAIDRALEMDALVYRPPDGRLLDGFGHIGAILRW